MDNYQDRLNGDDDALIMVTLGGNDMEGESKFECCANGLAVLSYPKLYCLSRKPHEYCACYRVGHLNALLRGLVIGRIGVNGDKAVIAEAKSRFNAHCDGSALLPADLRGAVRIR